METKEKMKAARNEKSVVAVKQKVDFLDTEGNKSFGAAVSGRAGYDPELRIHKQIARAAGAARAARPRVF